ncbi:MAG: histone deacetylase [Gemmataceae bacterium]
MKLFYTDEFVLPLPEKHRFPMSKYALLRHRLLESELVSPSDLWIPHAATMEELLLAHSQEYVRRAMNGDLTEAEVRRIGFPWSPELVERSRRSVGATVEASRAALGNGFAANLAGGTHHAFRDCGEGYCVFNDAVVAVRTMQEENRIRRAIIIDCDVHQGNGTASILADDPSVFTLSIHGEKNFPLRKERSDLDIGLPKDTTDELFLEALETGLKNSLPSAEADLAVYLAGADPYVGDRLGSLAVTKEGLAARDRMVFDQCQSLGIPVVIAMAGGYAPDVADIVDIHFQTIAEALRRCS